ncbi:acyl-CoA thioesterase domain-containing protein [Thorsellia kenyensis]|uniref:Acyl-CoA thioesterase domain-containing protein n=1 Tax=Thorsellia kenyensis TaxID=1549888 RepID=A0ABV6C698_9GAMM
MSSGLGRLISLLELTTNDFKDFEGRPLDLGLRQLYGGLIFAQAISAAVQSQNKWCDLKSLTYASAMFLNPGDTKHLICYEVEIIKKGKSFDFIQVKAIQNQVELMRLQANFHKEEKGFAHQIPKLASITPPEELISEYELIKQMSHLIPDSIKAYWLAEPAFDIRPLKPLNPFRGSNEEPNHISWFKLFDSKTQLNPFLCYALLAYISDHNLLPCALRPHNKGFLEKDMQVATINHTIWFHSLPNLNEWEVFSIESSVAKNALALSNGHFFDTMGQLVATVTQEGLIRQHESH